ncbi:hypothetical protein [Polyangium sp. 15x6]|uniref:hypothetical protein n=1 Tax=Polyangium sp. 15x6 TaxID=3042687 RepID=UPI00249CA3AA|nr:hypothetical protein [Polyangium sp. 15x6]MDI3286767.1 hypothetical protein [Polyangium sp. 15x6]
MRTVSWLGFGFLCLVGSACGAKVVVDAEGGSGGSPPCTPGEVAESCYTGPPSTNGVGICHAGVRVCTESGTPGACEGEVLPSAEICDNGLDEDCNGTADDFMPCGGFCKTCSNFLSDMHPELPFCPESQSLHDTLLGCLCAGPCATVCTATLCVGSDPSQPCVNCALDPSEGCSVAFNACLDD